jgi:uncharacterized protein YacL
MSNQKNDVERLKRIRDKQLRARDPQKKVRKTQHNIASRYRSSRKPETAKSVMADIPKKWLGFVIGLFLGFIVLVLLPMFVDSTSTDLIGIGVMVALAFLGFAVGQAADTKSELEDLIR